ncbi:LysR family transcriptional regulator [Mesorhizobium sp.]|uniref:LysR family transcriptional regulator n=1 Tax=Mesorhizobium sp. TaxID=1871066 RepID=UPI00120E5B1F|nr:LysR family transcriptional regulator [Mesorhizobium sp.]TIO05398.1 MAG: LysR family transcriptional regulator [Mesorhizobium sp.]TIO33048.1 MAG: LysR family transcriptional regulator [Mesorhizobium sp.]TIP14965.1 MAG: LysR family transcriptional regulator [Mesorhizobium sp.]
MRRLDNIDIRLLRVFVALADSGGFADAQITLNLSQPTLSTHLAELEKRIGAQLCHRGRKQFRLTEVGQATYDAAQKLFRDLDDFGHRISAASGSLSGRLRIGTSDGVFTSDELGIQHALRRFMSPDSDVFIDLSLGTPSELEQQVADGGRDIVIGPLSQKAPGVVYRDYCGEPHFLYCGRRHPLFAVPDSRIDQSAIHAARFSVRSYRYFDDLYLVGHPKASASVIHMEAQLMLILSENFIGFLPAHFASSWVHAGELRAIKPGSYTFSSRHLIAYRRADETRNLVQAFLQELTRGSETGPLKGRGAK